MFDDLDHWATTDDYPTLYRVDRPAWVHFQTLFPDLGRRLIGVPMWLRSGGLRIEPWQRGRQVAWMRRFLWRLVDRCARSRRQRERCIETQHAVVAGAGTVQRYAAAGMG